MKTQNWQNPRISYLTKAKHLEDEALLMKGRHLKGAPIKPEKIGKMYEDAGDLRRKGKDFVGAEDDYLNANKYGYAYSSVDSERVRKAINEVISEKRKSLGLPLENPLERAFAYLAILSFGAALLAISLKLTGSVIGPSSANTKWIGLCLFLVGCMFTFFYFRAKRK